MSKSSSIRILVKGGILTPRFMQQITKVAKDCENTCISFGSRQDILFKVPDRLRNDIEPYLYQHNISFEWKNEMKSKAQNIVTSYVATDILQGTPWVNSSTFINILENFDYNPSIRINIVDPRQKLVPLFSGNLNFVASESENYWHLFIKKSGIPSMLEWPELIYSAEIAMLSSEIELVFNSTETDINIWHKNINSKLELTSQKISKGVSLTAEFAPYYEGINKMQGRNDYWIGFYWRNNEYTIEFIDYICELALRTRVAKISITPWKSFLVKNIKESDKMYWEQLIGIYGINMRHSSIDMFWHLPYGSKQALKLKKYLVNKLDKTDIRTYGLTFSIGNPEVPFTSVIIKPKIRLKFLGMANPFSQYEIWIAIDFNTNTNQYALYATGLDKYELPSTLVTLAKEFYQKLNRYNHINIPQQKVEKSELTVYQCTECLHIYAPQVGEPQNNIAANTTFNQLPESFICDTCEAPKKNFIPITIDKNLILAN